MRERETTCPLTLVRGATLMRVIVKKVVLGRREYMVVPGRESHLAPIVLRGVTKGTLREALKQTLDTLERAGSVRGPGG